MLYAAECNVTYSIFTSLLSTRRIRVHNLIVIWEACASLCPALFRPVYICPISMTPSSPTTSKRLSLTSVEWQHTSPNRLMTAARKRAGLRKNATEINQPRFTLWDCFKKFRVSDDLTLLHFRHTVRFLGLAPEVGASVHAGYVEEGYALQRHVA